MIVVAFSSFASTLVRHGWPGDAVLEVTLYNNQHGFRYEEYGDSITVRRTIKQPSGGSFALIGHDKAVSFLFDDSAVGVSVGVAVDVAVSCGVAVLVGWCCRWGLVYSSQRNIGDVDCGDLLAGTTLTLTYAS